MSSVKSGLPLTWGPPYLQALIGSLAAWLGIALMVAVVLTYVWVMNRLVGRGNPAPHPAVPARSSPSAIIEDGRKAA